MPVSIKDIAKRANVAPSTVSRALKKSPWIGRETRARIARIAQEMGYVPSAAARSLAGKPSRTIGICLPRLASQAIAEQLAGIDEAAANSGYKMLFARFDAHRQRELDCVQDFQEWRAEGIIVCSSEANRSHHRADGNHFTPIVAVNSSSYPYSVTCEREEGVRMAVRHLLDFGHRRIAVIHSAPPEDSGWGDDDVVLEGYRRALEERGIPLRHDLLFPSHHQFGGGIQVARKLVRMPQPPTAVFACNDVTAIAFIHGLQEFGLAVPEDVSIAALDSFGIPPHYTPRLTSLKQPNRQLGQLAFEMLLQLILAKEPLPMPAVLPPRLVIGSSTGPPQ